MTSRRDLLLALGAFGAFGAQAALPRALGASFAERPRDPLNGVGIQLYMVRQEMRRDPEATIARIAMLGFSEVEWWGAWDRTPVQLRALLDRHGLRSPAAHIDPRDLTRERLPALLETAQVMGHESLLVAWTPPTQRSADDWKRLAALLSEAGRTASRVGIRTGYHNHDFEFADLGGRTALEILLDESDPAFVSLEVDCFWALKAGQDPRALIERHAARVTHLHLKDSSGAPAHRQLDVGSGVIEWKALLESAVARKVQHVYVEHDEPADAWMSATASLGHLRTLGY